MIPPCYSTNPERREAVNQNHHSPGSLFPNAVKQPINHLLTYIMNDSTISLISNLLTLNVSQLEKKFPRLRRGKLLFRPIF
jgi:hypothetical protein